MKTFRLIGMAIMAVMLCFNFTACSNDGEVEPVEPQKPKEYTVSLGFTGEISISESPLSRTSGNDLYGIQVYSCPNVDGAATYSYYAYGLFDDTSAMTIKLMEGYKYKFEATMVVDGKERITLHSTLRTYGVPFNEALTNNFTYSSTDFFSWLDRGQTAVNGSTPYIPNVDRYYGLFSDYEPTENGIVSIKMLRTVFGIKVKADNMTEGKLSVVMNEASEIVVNYPEDEIEDIFTFKYVGEAYSTENYSETIPTTITWTKADGVVVPLGTHNITFKRNVQTTVTIKVADVTTENGIGIELENAEMGTDDITIENGKIVDTNVGTDAE